MKFNVRPWFTRFSLTLMVVGGWVSSGSAAQATTFRFNTDPFAGTTVLTTPGRQFVGNELFINEFVVGVDQFSFDPNVFGVSTQVSFFNGLAASLPTGGLNVIVLQDSDNDNNPATAFNAGIAANLIAAAFDTPGAGFFIYFNSALNLNRLVYSPDLSDPNSDLKILARITSPVGQGAINALPTFTASNFVTEVPEPATGLLGMGAVGFFGWLKRRRQEKVIKTS